MAKATVTIGGLTFTARADGGSGNFIGISVGITNLPAYVVVTGNLITINTEHDGVAFTTSISTRNAIAAAIAAVPAADALVEVTGASASIFPYTYPPVGYTFLTGGTDPLVHSAASAVSATSSSTVAAILMAGTVSAVFGLSNAVAIPTMIIAAESRVNASATAVINGGVANKVESHVFATSQADGSATLVRTSLTVCDVLRDIMMCWGMEQPCAAPEMAKISALNVLNNAMQVLWNQAKDRNYWTQSTINVTFNTGVTESILANEIQNVVGPARLSTGQLLVPLANISEAENFADAFVEDGTNNGPVSYYIERNNQAGADPAKCTMIISPAPTGNITVRLDVVTEAPRYYITDFVSCPLCPIPHKYVESLLMPVCRYLASHSHLFIQRERQEVIQNDYMQAAKLLDVADPLPGQSGENIGYRKGEREKS